MTTSQDTHSMSMVELLWEPKSCAIDWIVNKDLEDCYVKISAFSIYDSLSQAAGRRNIFISRLLGRLITWQAVHNDGFKCPRRTL